MENLEDELSKRDSEIERLNAALEKAVLQEQEFMKSRKALLFMMEDLNGTTRLLLKAKSEWEATFDAISDPIFIHDREFRIVRANRAYRDAAGVEFSELIGQRYFEVFPKMDVPFKMCFKQEQEQEQEQEQVISADRTFRVRFYPVLDEDKKYLYDIHVLEDITDAKNALEKLKGEMEITSNLLMISEATLHIADMDKLMEQVVHSISSITGCKACLSYLWDEEAGLFKPTHAFGLPLDLLPLFRTEMLDKDMPCIKDAMDKGKPALMHPYRAEENSRCFSWVPFADTMVAIPIISKKRYLGLIVSVYEGMMDAPSELTERDWKIMQGISNQVSIALEEARLYKESIDRGMELSHKIETIQVMNEIDRSILSTLESDEIMETVVRMIAKVVHCDMVILALVDKVRNGFVYGAGFGLASIKKFDFVSFGETSTTEVVETSRPQYVANLKEMKKLLEFEQRLVGDSLLSHIRLPLIAKGNVVGVLNVGSKRIAAYTPDDLSTIEKLASQIGVAMENSRLVSDLKELFISTIKSLSSAIDAKSAWTAGHSERVTRYALVIAKQMGLSDDMIKELELAGLLHDIGKIGTYESILDKPGRLTDEELAVMRQHPVKGAEILYPIKQLRSVIPAVKGHHEYYDGKGYPDGLKGEEIHFFARILAVADTVDAMGANRPYREGREMAVILSELKRCSGTQFDPEVVEAFMRIADTLEQ